MKFLAQTDIDKVFGQVSPPPGVQTYAPGARGISDFIGNFVSLIYIVGTIFVLLMFLWGALDWIMSGGEKEAVAKARGKITNAIIGFVIMALTYVILSALGTLLGIEIFTVSNPTGGFGTSVGNPGP